MPRQPGPPRTQLPVSKIYTYMYKHFTDKARDHRRPLDETQGGGGGEGEGGGGGGEGRGGGGGEGGGRMPTFPAYPN